MKLYSTTQGIARSISDDRVEFVDIPAADLSELLRGAGLEALEHASGTTTANLADLTLLAPTPRPGKVVFIGLNYPSHALEVAQDGEHSRGEARAPKRPSFFIAPSSAVIGSGRQITRPHRSPGGLDYEGELAVVIGRTAKDVDPSTARDHIAGYTIANDVSSRDLQLKAMRGVPGIDIAIAKSFDTFKPLGPCLVTNDSITDPNDLRLRTWVNGEPRQDARTSECYFSVEELVAYVSSYMTLDPGDVICTGSPSGSGMFTQRQFLEDGDVVRIEIEGIGELVNTVGS